MMVVGQDDGRAVGALYVQGTILAEVNDGYALGSYGLRRNLYVLPLSARWRSSLASLTSSATPCVL